MKMSPKEINEFLGRKVMGWTLRRSKNPRYDWYVDANGRHNGLVRNWNPSGHCYGSGIEDCFRIINKLTIDGFVKFQLVQVNCVGGFTWAASIIGWRYQQRGVGVRDIFGGAGKTIEEAICSMAVKTVLDTPGENAV